jgi:hypothetical protein
MRRCTWRQLKLVKGGLVSIVFPFTTAARAIQIAAPPVWHTREYDAKSPYREGLTSGRTKAVWYAKPGVMPCAIYGRGRGEQLQAQVETLWA